MKPTTKGICMAAGAAGLWGLMSIFTRALHEVQYSGVDIAYLRCLVAGVGMVLYLSRVNPSALQVGVRGAVIPLLYGAVTYSIGFTGYNIAVTRIPVAVATVLTFMNPIFVCIFSVLVFHETIPVRKLVSIALCVFGAVLATNLLGVGDFRLDLLGVAAALLNGLGVSFQVMIPRYFAPRFQRDTMLAYGFLGAALVLGLLADHQTIAAGLTGPNGAGVLFSVLCFGVLCTLIANTCFSKSALYVDATTTSILSALEVVVGSVVGLLVFQERLTPLQAAGAVIIVLGSLGAELLDQKKSVQQLHS